MDFGGVPFGAAPYGGNIVSDAGFSISLAMNLIFPVDFVFFGDIGDVIFLPPGLDLVPANLHYRRSPCLLYEN